MATVFPDATKVLIDRLGPTMDPVPVVASIPQPRDLPFLLVERIGGVRRNIVTDEPTMFLTSQAATWEAAEDNLQKARAAVHELATGAEASNPIYATIEISGPARFPDPEAGSNEPRMRMTVRIALRGSEQTL